MKRLVLVLGTLCAISTPAFAPPVPVSSDDPNPTVMFGISIAFGDGLKAADVGFTLKGLSTNRPNEFVVGGGVSYFPWSEDKKGQIGLDLSVGYNFDHGTALVGYDVLRWNPQISLGYSWTKEREDEDELVICLAC